MTAISITMTGFQSTMGQKKWQYRREDEALGEIRCWFVIDCYCNVLIDFPIFKEWIWVGIIARLVSREANLIRTCVVYVCFASV